mgnify:CR=1 FL=1
MTVSTASAHTADRGTWLLIVCCLSQFIHTVYGSIVNIALPAISHDLGAGIDSLQWLVSAYVLSLAALLILSGALADRFGRKRILIIGNVVMVIGAVVCALSPDVAMLIAGRVVQGIGSALIAPAGLALLTAAFPAMSKRAIAVMWWTTFGTVSLAAGPILGGLLVNSAGWQSVFWAGVPLGAVAIVLAAVLLTESKSATPSRFDPVGQVLLTLALATLAFVLIEGVHLGWGSPAIIAGSLVVVVSFAALIAYEQKHPHPLVPVSLFRNRPFTTALSTAVLGYLALAGLLFLNTFSLQSARGLDPMSAGLLTLPLAVGATIAAQLSGSLVAKGRSREILLLSGALIAAASLALWATEHAALWWVIAPYFAFGLGVGFISDPISVTALSTLPTSKAGLASSLISTANQVGQMLGIAAAGTLLALAAGTSETTAFDAMGGWVWGMLAACGAGVLRLNLRKPRSSKLVDASRPTIAPGPALDPGV